MSKGIKRFLMICAIMAAAGIAVTIAGYAAGGMNSMSQISEKYDWFRAGPVEKAYISLEDNEEFDAVDIKGEIDVVICRGDKGAELEYDKSLEAPVFEVINGILTVDTTASSRENIYLNFSIGDSTPELIIYVPENISLQDINISCEYGDVDIENVTAGSADISQGYGDIEISSSVFGKIKMETECGDIVGDDIKCGETYAESQLGDVKLAGEFAGMMQIECECGDIMINTCLAEEAYTVYAEMECGELNIGGRKYECFDRMDIDQGKGSNVIKVKDEQGDVDIGFSN